MTITHNQVGCIRRSLLVVGLILLIALYHCLRVIRLLDGERAVRTRQQTSNPQTMIEVVVTGLNHVSDLAKHF